MQVRHSRKRIINLMRHGMSHATGRCNGLGAAQGFFNIPQFGDVGIRADRSWKLALDPGYLGKTLQCEATPIF